jgi:hypothetical protein
VDSLQVRRTLIKRDEVFEGQGANYEDLIKERGLDQDHEKGGNLTRAKVGADLNQLWQRSWLLKDLEQD